MDQRVNPAVRLVDDRSFMRRQLFRLFALNAVDAIKFYYFMGEKSQLPVVGHAFKALMTAYYKHVHTAAVKLPLQDIEEVINATEHISVGPCACRAVFDKGCDAPLYCCIKINTFSKMITSMEKLAAKLRAKRGLKVGNPYSKELTKAEAIAIVRNARKHGLVLSLESCIEPYQYNICSCCADCCIELNMRYKFGLDVSPRGPYEPVVNAADCKQCGACAKRCPVKAISLTDDKRPVIDLNQCLGCGLCAEQCKSGGLTMVLDESRIPSYEEPGALKLSYVFFLAFTTFLVFSGYKLTHRSENVKYHLARPRPTDVIQ
jgi:Pyruvate/2-oxoacid:ferredoxin oxidoreductase delta subunit